MKQNIRLHHHYLCTVLSIGILLLISFSTFAENSKREWHAARALPRKAGEKSVQVQVVKWGRTGTISLMYRVPEPVMKKNPYQRIGSESTEQCIVGNCRPISIEGKPVIPDILVKVILPYGHTVNDIEVERKNRTFLPGNHLIEFGPAVNPLIAGAMKRRATPEQAIYNSDNAYPAENYRLVSIQKGRGVTSAYIRIPVISYYPQSRRIAYYKDIAVQIFTKPEQNYGAGNATRVRLKGMKVKHRDAENIEMLDTYHDGLLRGSYQHNMNCNPLDDYAWVIVTSESIKNASTIPSVDDYVQHRKSKGFTATVKTIEDIYNDYTGVDNTEKLRNFIRDAYNSWGTEFVFLGGDVNVVPHRELWVFDPADVKRQDSIPSDLYLQCLDGSYNSNNNKLWGEENDGGGGGEVDLAAEIYIGRASANTATEMSNMLYKMMAYENMPSSDDYFTDALMLGEKLGFGDPLGEYAKPALQMMVNGVDTTTTIYHWGVNMTGYNSNPDFSVDALYEMDQSYGKNDVLQKINADKYSVFNHFGHTNTSYGLKLRNGDESSFTNENFIFSYSQGCMTGDISKDCLAERFTTTNRNGFWGVIFNSHYGLGNAYSLGPSNFYHCLFWDAYFGDKIEYVGELNADSHEDGIYMLEYVVYRWCLYETNLLGDPAIKMRGMETAPYISISSPCGGENWEQGRSFDILWDDNITENVKIEVLKGSAVKEVLSASETSDGSYTWNIPDTFTIGNDYKVRVTSVNNGSLVDESFDVFAIEKKSTLTLTAPNGGETLIKGSETDITWDDNLSGTVNIDLYKDGLFCRNIVLNTPSDGSHKWTVPLVVSKANDYTVCITSVDKTWLFVESASPFSVDNPVITQFPYVEDFDDFEEGSGALGGFWEQIEGDDDLNWTVQSGPTPSNTTGPDSDHTSGNGKYIFTEASSDGHPDKKFHAVTPVFDFKIINEPVLTFWFHMRSDTNRMGDLYVDISKDGAWDQGVIHLSGDRGHDWHDTTMDLSAYEDKMVQIRFRGITGIDFDSDMAVDDIKIDGKINALPAFTSTPNLKAKVDVEYVYNITVTDTDDDDLTISKTTLPGWLTLTDNGDGTGTLKGTPEKDDVGDHNVVLTADDGIAPTPVEQSFTVTVEKITPIVWDPVDGTGKKARLAATPNPVEHYSSGIDFLVDAAGCSGGELRIYDGVGNTLHTIPVSANREAALHWNLCNSAGVRVRNGTCLAVLNLTKADGTVESAKLLIGVKEKVAVHGFKGSRF